MKLLDFEKRKKLQWALLLYHAQRVFYGPVFILLTVLISQDLQ